MKLFLAGWILLTPAQIDPFPMVLAVAAPCQQWRIYKGFDRCWIVDDNPKLFPYCYCLAEIPK